MSEEINETIEAANREGSPSPSSDKSPSNLVIYGTAVLLLIIMVIMATSSMRLKSPTTDEVTEISAGYDILRTGDFSAAGSHPIFLQALAAVPLLTLPDLQLPNYQRPFFAVGTIDDVLYWRHGLDFFAANSQQVDQIIFAARLAIVGLALVLGLFMFRWSKNLYGAIAGLLALFLFVFSPNILANGTLATLDLGFTALTFITFYFFWRLVTRPHISELILAGIALGLTLATKVNAPIIFVPLFLLILVSPRKDVGQWSWTRGIGSRRWLQNVISFIASLTAMSLIAWLVINLIYGFSGAFQPLRVYLPSLPGILGNLPMPFPEQFSDALLFQIGHASGGHAAFLLGRYNPNGWWFYHAFTFLFKVPIPMMLLTVGAVIFSYKNRKEDGLISTAEYFLLIPALSIFIIISFFSIKVGFRHILPIMPFLFVYASKLGKLLNREHKYASVAIGALSAWYLIASLFIYPDYLSYFNEIAGGPNNGWRYLVDSNIDWGQDLKGLKTYMEANDIEEIKLSYFGSADPDFYDIDYQYLPSVGLKPSEPDGKWFFEEGYEEDCQPTTGTLAISVTNLQGGLLNNRDCFAWLRGMEPDAKVGYSIFIYEIEEVPGG